MLYTFEMSESQLDRVDDYLAGHYQDRPDQYILCVQRHLSGMTCSVIIDCDSKTATFITLLVA